MFAFVRSTSRFGFTALAFAMLIGCSGASSEASASSAAAIVSTPDGACPDGSGGEPCMYPGGSLDEGFTCQTAPWDATKLQCMATPAAENTASGETTEGQPLAQTDGTPATPTTPQQTGERADGRCGAAFDNATCNPGRDCDAWGFCQNEPAPTPALRTDGRCGPDFGNAGCPTGKTCSEWEWCN